MDSDENIAGCSKENEVKARVEETARESQIDWTICVLCTNPREMQLRTSEVGLKVLSEQLLKYKGLGGIIRKEFEQFNDENELFSFLLTHNALYHNNCYNYRDDKLARFQANKSKLFETANTLLEGSRKRSIDWHLGDLRCAICEGSDTQKKLVMAAETKRKSGADASAYLKAKTEEWQTLAKTPGYEHLDSRLCIGDLRSNEI